MLCLYFVDHTKFNEKDRIKIDNVFEVIHIPTPYQQFKSSLDIPLAAAAALRNTPSTSRTLVRSSTDQYYVEINAPNSTNKTGNGQKNIHYRTI